MALGSGDRAIAPSDGLLGLIGEADQRIRIPVVECRLPRVQLGAMAGAALGIGGTIFHSLSRNPLGSPDIIGI
ncbi:iron chelate uptake ABC transporter family permease subunit [Bosea sp. Root381]|uniref:iron chelate uptake ABC transporter family permease subunit n=1 Tax=Bosea sp. Root381 TaxID=1736524 RepID=UPI0019110F01|nr:iron chelate uptake ABC transporter family permease subunit [Bosea sp. Root381]